MKIVHLSERAEYIETIAQWLFDEWGHLRKGSTLEHAVQLIKKRSKGKHIPSIFVAETGGEPAGTVSLIECDMEMRKNLSPWVASLYIRKEFRNKGLGRALMEFIESFAKNLDIKKIYLYTPDRQEMYSKLGWKAIEGLEYRFQAVTIMEKYLTGI